ncbi:MAG: peroxiredoxin [Pseudomonadota bacterium]
MAESYYEIDWATLPTPEDDGAADHLMQRELPGFALPSTAGAPVELAALPGLTILYIYPKTGQPGTPMPDGWDMIPGARGCTPQSCSFRDHWEDLKTLGVDHLFGLSSQDTAYQAEARDRMHLPFEILSDADFGFANALELPTFEAGGERLFKRMSLGIEGGRIVHVAYPVFPPDRNPEIVMDWLSSR